MSVRRTRPRPIIIPNARKNVDLQTPPHLGNLTPDLQPNSPPVFPCATQHEVARLGQYILTEPLDGEDVYQAVNIHTHEKFICKVYDIHAYRQQLRAYWSVDYDADCINHITEIILGETKAYAFFEKNFGDLHTHVRNERKLKEREAKKLFAQIVRAVQRCHENGIVLRDLKLRKFVFQDELRKKLKLEGLEDSFVLEDEHDDSMRDKHGCPAYVSPEILCANTPYSGKAADMWSLGVILYTMLFGRYPFHDTEPSALFRKILRGQYNVPETVSSKARCLIRSLLRQDPSERLTADEVLRHPWFRTGSTFTVLQRSERKNLDQEVPDVYVESDEDDVDDDFAPGL
ncbi:tribbles homolog 2-like [Lingula anatina]|uniref:Tribbles homolog 2-like n=1 Tax=Lingula anatina TaxID=7574 RepID=A0A1S3JHM4_LINAN|nr:tribbles homolog 2-like [Lingula anatina]|eukprot:XP_013409915.1 tribbles homolog 2-like [Lingula anatina]